MTFDRILDLIHGYWAYLVLLVLILATLNALIKFFTNKAFGENDFKISLFALIATHIQVLIGFILYFTATLGYSLLADSGMKVMKNSEARFFAIEHPLTMIIAVVLITIGYSKHKKQLTSKAKFKTLAVFYTIALILVLSRIPWDHWFTGSH